MTTRPEETEAATARRLPARYPVRGGLSVLARNLRHKAELRRILLLLDRASVQCFVLKGIPLTLELYGSLADRPMVDIDVVVPQAQAERAYRALRAGGLDDLPGYSFGRSRQYNYQHPLVATAEKSARTLVELHWHGFSPWMFRVPESLMFFEQRSVFLAGETYAVMNRELSLCHLCAHALQHELAKPSILFDIGRAWDCWQEHLDLKRLHGLASSTGTYHALVFLLGACYENALTETPPPKWPSARAAFARRMLPGKLPTIQPKSSTPRALLVLTLLNWDACLDVVGDELFPHPKKLAHIHGPLSGSRLWRIYFTRPLRIFTRSGRPVRRVSRPLPR